MKKSFQFLELDDVKKVHQATLDILERVGIACQSENFNRFAADHGCKVEGGRIKFPPGVVEKYLKMAPEGFNLYGREGQVLEFGKRQAYSQICSGTPTVNDLDTGERRNYVLQDLIDITRLVDELPNIHIVSCGVPTDVDQKVYMVVEIATMLQNSSKPCRLPIESAVELKEVSEVLSVVSGSMDEFRKKPLLYLEVSPLSPLDFGKEPAECIVALAEAGIPVGIIPCPMMGATGPMTLVGSVTQHNAELVAGVVAAQMANPGVPTVMSPRVTFMDMKSGTALWAAPETGIAGACSAHMANYYKIPVTVSGFSVASQVADQQAGYERTFNAMATAMVGVDVLGAAASLDNALTTCYIQAILDDEICSLVRRALRPLEVNEDTLAVDAIAEVIQKNTSFLGLKHTRNYLRKGELWVPSIGSRLTFEEWAKECESVEQAAKRKATQILKAERRPILDTNAEKEIEAIIQAAMAE
ncbi:MAG: trimethylamine methyltransferase family protein [Bacillota bacterium]